MDAWGTGLACLPDDVVIRILRFCPLEERLRTIALVNTRLAGLCSIPELMRYVDIFVRIQQLAPLERWLGAHAPHLRQLSLQARTWTPADAISRCIAACSAAGQLQEMTLFQGAAACADTAWPPGLGASLRRLKLATGDVTGDSSVAPVVRLAASMSGLSRLESLTLELDRFPQRVPADFPPSLTFLHIEQQPVPEDEPARPTAMPIQLSKLRNLKSLNLWNLAWSGVSMAHLSRITPGLTSLLCSECYALPPRECLAAATQLQELSVYALCVSSASRATCQTVLDGVLSRLSQLTSLQLLGVVCPAGAAGLPLLADVELYDDGPEEGTEQEGQAGVPLPSGPWPSLRRLQASWHTLKESAGVLAGMRRLPHLIVDSTPVMEEGTVSLWRAFWGWAAGHEALARLEVAMPGEEKGFSRPLIDALLDLQRRRPRLHICTACN